VVDEEMTRPGQWLGHCCVFPQCSDTVGWQQEGHQDHKKPTTLIPRDSLLEQGGRNPRRNQLKQAHLGKCR